VTRGCKVRFGPADGGAEPPEPVPAIGPVVFDVVFGGTAVTVDLSDLPGQRLVRPLAAALASIGGDHGTVRTLNPDFRQKIRHLREFARFASDRLEGGHGAAAGLGDVSAELLEDFEAGLIGRYGTTGSQVQGFMATVIRLLKLAEQADPGVLTAAVQARLSYSTSLPARKDRPLNAYPVAVLEAIQRAALADARMIREQAGPGNSGGGPVFLTPVQAVPLLVALICLTGLEPECAKGLRAGCLSSPSASGFMSLAYVKKRAHTRTCKTMRVRTGGITTPAGLISVAIRLTEPARQAAGSDALWVGAGGDGLRAWFDTGYELTSHLRAWASKHGLDQLDDHGGGKVRLDLRRIRKSVKSRRYLQSGGILDDFTAGHTKAVAAARYADIDAHNALHDQAVEDGLRQALAAALPAPVTVTTAGKPLAVPGGELPLLTPAQHQAAVTAEQDVFLASCSGFHASPFARTAGDGCPVAAWGCLECPNAVFTERHLPSLTAFETFLDNQREEMDSAQWQARYGMPHHRLTTGIFPAFSPGQHAAARRDSADPGSTASLPARLLELLT
jgi:hypothetical protein